MTKMKEEECYTLLILGDTVVGKTCFILRLTDNFFQEAHLSTMGFDYKLKSVTLKNGRIINAKIWDTVGQEKYKSLAKSYYKGSQGIILIYDITNRKSFDSIDNWVEQINDKANPDTQILLLGNKCDLENDRKVSKEEGEELAKKYKLTFFETSVKDMTNINESFNLLVERVDEIGFKKSEQLKLTKAKAKKDDKKCCLKKG